MLSPILFFILTTATLFTLAWAGIQLLKPTQDPLGDRLFDFLQRSGGIGQCDVIASLRGGGSRGRSFALRLVGNGTAAVRALEGRDRLGG